MENDDQFLLEMRELNPEIVDYVDALVFAIENVERYVHRGEVLYFGRVGEGTFFTGGDFDRCRWYPDTNPVEAIGLISVEFGEELSDELEAFKV
jgi:hypothetical protein